MSNARSVDPGIARQDMITDEVDHDALANQIWTAMERAIAAAANYNYAEVNIPQLLRSMRETHGSMRAVYTAATRVEDAKKEPTGRWADMLILSRAQLDAVFIGLLLAHDPQKWGPKYYKSGWATDAQMHFYAMRRFVGLKSEQEIRNRNVFCLKMRARFCQVTAKEWIATLSAVRGKPMRFGATNDDRIKPFPTPGQIADLLKGGRYEALGVLLWQEWKFLCDPAHAGLATLTLRHAMRDQQIGDVGSAKRAEMIQQEVLARSIHPSLVAIMTLTTVLAVMHRDNPDLLAAVVEGWKILEQGTREGGIIWDNWASGALGVLRPLRA